MAYNDVNQVRDAGNILIGEQFYDTGSSVYKEVSQDNPLPVVDSGLNSYFSATIGDTTALPMTVNVDGTAIETPDYVSWSNSDVINTYKEIYIDKPTSSVKSNLQLVLNTNSVDSDFEVSIYNRVSGLITTASGSQINAGDRYALLTTTLVPKLVLQSANVCYVYTASATTYSDETNDINSAITSDVQAPPISTASDAIYFGDTVRFDSIKLVMGSGGNYSGSMVWEYSNATGGWTAIPTITDNTASGGLPFVTSGNVNFSIPSDWTELAVSSTTKYWVRCRCSAVNTITTAPLITQAWYRVPSKTTNTKAVNINGSFVTGKLLIALKNLTAISATGACNVWAWLWEAE